MSEVRKVWLRPIPDCGYKKKTLKFYTFTLNNDCCNGENHT